MKLIIDIPEEYLKTIKAISDETSSFDMLLIKYGTPFDSVIEDIKAEIKAEIEPKDLSIYNAGMNFGLDLALEIIDKHISGKGTDETDC